MRVLQVMSELDGGGVERLMYEYCRRIPEIQFDFTITAKNEGILEKPLKELGCNIYHTAKIRENPLLYIKQLKNVIANGKYDIVHSHISYGSAFAMYLAAKCGVKVRIAHSHDAYIPQTFAGKIERQMFTAICKKYATDLFACGNDAARWLWGKKVFNEKKIYIVHNAIDTKQFAFSEETRYKMRKELGIENKLVVGHVGRFTVQKNHRFLVRIFAEVKKLREDAVLLLVGRGVLEEEIKEQVRALGLGKDVLFLGVRNDVAALLNAMDIFVLPSLYEGLPVTLVEIQANGLASIVSDAVTAEIKLLDNIEYFSLNRSMKEWAKQIVSCDIHKRNVNGIEIIANSGYDVNIEAIKLKEKYAKLVY